MDQISNIHLRWNKHQATLMSVFDALLDNEKLTDCTISAEGHHLRAHKIILSACSPYFEELFTENNEKHPIIILHDIKYDVVKALLDFMYRGEVNIPQKELSGVLKLSESLQVRGLSGSGCVDGVNMQKGSGRDVPPVLSETLSAQPASVPCFTSGRNEPEDKLESFRGYSPTVSSQEGGSGEVNSVLNYTQKYIKSVNHCGSLQLTGQNTFKEVITPDLESVHHLPSQRQVLPATHNSTGGPVYNLVPLQSVCSELQSCNEKTVVAENERFSIPEVVLRDKISSNSSARKQEVKKETKFESPESHMEIIEDVTLDDGDNFRDGSVNIVGVSGRSARPETLLSQPTSMPCCTSAQNEPEQKIESFRGCSPAVSCQEEGSVERDSISKSIQKQRKDINHARSDRAGKNTFEDIITPDVDSVHQLPSERRVMATMHNSNGGPAYSPIRALKTLVSCAHTTICSSSYSPIPQQSVYSELQSFGRLMTVAENERFLMPGAVLPDKKSANVSAHQQEVSLVIKSEVPENHLEVVEDLTLDDDEDYLCASDYRDDCSSGEVDIEEVRRMSAGLTYKENFCTQGINNLHSLFGSVDLSNMTLTTSQTVLHNQFTCKSCGKSYQHPQGLQRHVNLQCGKERRYQCPRCNYRCARSDNLKTHMASRRCQMHKK
ncbi:uncharacterized protein LOC124717296 isoform X1 [Schistocerca piceifrons]|uniref:uncharacterized protein LOC124717296 isoform X1 n=1 Tax=Schistocerca piceifrons TaxID=274613 RepID=UPI001F5EEE1F|nr:uncharacterized protein LOC124717296 isoform X1 [Schistocerca piceifrons]XP_047100068.1 uncharacterized protein LOC124717296 isoform X1 [Schistocerca piceifrons]XP_047100069.1 uncharacterized protein LOC124717296 isoform X1 [Schistocerca piceifrons]XP_047100070.1 uncharacterized protein LOC124717296 isoform X1 [Schistocerca piceifrons]XP_047100071.1 uncharacterized protein LOC124717296 isoform X1 [Schistocerca piceifrons]XP_047100072.1 uncharacterized protein LOC124717296 isoform X1 [Schist